ncbi:unnamed protein product [Sphacelaria rigidula]
MSRSIPSSSSSEHNPELAAQAQRWIEEVTGEPFDSGLSFAEQLQDGRKLCLLVNKIKPGAVRRVNTSKMPFKQMENISNFLKAIREIGVKEYSLFETVDLFELKDFNLVISCLHALGGTAQSTCPDFQGPHLGLKPVTKSPRKVKSSVSKTEPTPPAAAPFQGCVATVPPSPVPQQIPSADTSFDGVDESAPPPPYNEAASRWGRKDDRVPLHRKDDEEEISPPPPFQEIASQTPPTALEGFTDKFTEAVSVSEKTGSQVPQANHLHEEASSPEARHPSAGRGGGYGLDAELAAKREANYDYELEYEAQEWIENVTGEQFQRAFAEELKDGRKLCVLINTIKPGVVRKVNDSRMPFKQMENISNFLKACRTVGVAEHSLFETVDLFEGKDVGLVVRCVHALGQTVQRTCKDYQGPRLGIKQTEANVREWTREQQEEQKRKSNGAMTQLMAGSSNTMERGKIIKEGVTFGASTSGTGDSSAIAKWTMGSSSTMERTVISKHGPTFGAEYVGTGDRNSVSKVTGGFR